MSVGMAINGFDFFQLTKQSSSQIVIFVHLTIPFRTEYYSELKFSIYESGLSSRQIL